MTSFLFQAHPVSKVYAGPIFWEADAREAVMRAYREFLPTRPRRVGHVRRTENGAADRSLSRGTTGASARAPSSRAYNGPADEGEQIVAALLKTLPPPIFNWMGAMPFPAMQGLFDPFFPKGMQWYWKGDYVKALSDEAIDAHIAQAAKAPSDFCLMHLYPIEGAVHRVAKDATLPGVHVMPRGRW